MALARADSSVLVVIDVQPSFLKAIHEAERVVSRTEFLVRIANLLDVPVLATAQNPERMGGLDPLVAAHLESPPIGKMTFACVGCPEFDHALAQVSVAKRQASGPRRQAVLTGIETHICVTQTALRLLKSGYDVLVCEDAVSARRREMNEIGFRRLRHSNADVTHTESVAYEWLGSAEHPRFREALEIVKSAG
jgi:nicotinamidase-related amidase